MDKLKKKLFIIVLALSTVLIGIAIIYKIHNFYFWGLILSLALIDLFLLVKSSFLLSYKTKMNIFPLYDKRKSVSVSILLIILFAILLVFLNIRGVELYLQIIISPILITQLINCFYSERSWNTFAIDNNGIRIPQNKYTTWNNVSECNLNMKDKKLTLKISSKPFVLDLKYVKNMDELSDLLLAAGK